MCEHRAWRQVGPETVHERFVRETVEAVADHALFGIARWQREACRGIRQRLVKCRIEASNVQRVRKTLLCLPDEIERRRNVQGSEMCRLLERGHYCWCDWLVLPKMRAAMHNAMSHGGGRNVNILLQNT